MNDIYNRIDEVQYLAKHAVRKHTPYYNTQRYDLEDLVQEGILRCLEHADKYDPRKGAFSTWVCLVARRGAERATLPDTRLCRGGGQPDISLNLTLHNTGRDGADTMELGDMIPAQEDVIDSLITRLDHQYLYDLMAKELTPREGLALSLVYLEGYSQVEAGRIMGTSHTAVWPLIHTALRKLRKAVVRQEHQRRLKALQKAART